MEPIGSSRPTENCCQIKLLKICRRILSSDFNNMNIALPSKQLDMGNLWSSHLIQLMECHNLKKQIISDSVMVSS